MVHQGQHHRQNSALWDKVHTDIALRTAHQWASRWARAARRGRADQEDMAQDILVAALIRSRHFDPAKAAWPTFIAAPFSAPRLLTMRSAFCTWVSSKLFFRASSLLL